MRRSAQETIDAFLADLENRGQHPDTRRQRQRYLTEYLHHAAAAHDAPDPMTVEELLDPDRATAWLTDAAAGKTRQRNTLHGPHAPAAHDTDRIRRTTYNLLATYTGAPWRLPIPPQAPTEHLTPHQARDILQKLSGQQPPAADTATWTRTTALAALVAATGRTVDQLAPLNTTDLHLHRHPRRVLTEDGPIDLDPTTAATLRRWLRQRAAITAQLEGTDPGYLWIPTKPGRPRGGTPPPKPGLKRAAIRTLHAAHRRLVLELLNHPLPPRALRTGQPTPPPSSPKPDAP